VVPFHAPSAQQVHTQVLVQGHAYRALQAATHQLVQAHVVSAQQDRTQALDQVHAVSVQQVHFQVLVQGHAHHALQAATHHLVQALAYNVLQAATHQQGAPHLVQVVLQASTVVLERLLAPTVWQVPIHQLVQAHAQIALLVSTQALGVRSLVCRVLLGSIAAVAQLTVKLVLLVLAPSVVLVALHVGLEHIPLLDRRPVATVRQDHSVIQQVQKLVCYVAQAHTVAAGQLFVCSVHLERLATQAQAIVHHAQLEVLVMVSLVYHVHLAPIFLQTTQLVFTVSQVSTQRRSTLKAVYLVHQGHLITLVEVQGICVCHVLLIHLPVIVDLHHACLVKVASILIV
jgi:hypothetical protein